MWETRGEELGTSQEPEEQTQETQEQESTGHPILHCGACGVATLTNDDLLVHMMSHEGVKVSHEGVKVSHEDVKVSHEGVKVSCWTRQGHETLRNSVKSRGKNEPHCCQLE